jgi:hypothetical protein
MVVSGIVIMNIMLAVVTECTHEIGIPKSLGPGVSSAGIGRGGLGFGVKESGSSLCVVDGLALGRGLIGLCFRLGAPFVFIRLVRTKRK